MPLPEPREDEEQDEYISRCTSFVFEENPEMKPDNEDDRKQAVAMCFSTWRRAKGIPEPKEGMKEASTEEELKRALDEIIAQIKAKEKPYEVDPELAVLWAKRRGIENAIAEFEKRKLMETQQKQPKIFLLCEKIGLEGNKVRGIAIHPKRLFHPEETTDAFQEHVYLKEELKKAALTAKGKPYGEDHLYLLPKPNINEKGWWDEQENGIGFEGIVDDRVAENIRNKVYKGVSIEIDPWAKVGGLVERVDGIAPKNFEIKAIHFMKRFPPADPDTYVKLFEGLKEQLYGVPYTPDIREEVKALRQFVETNLAYIKGRLDTLAVNPSKVIAGGAYLERSQIREEFGKLSEAMKLMGEKIEKSKTVDTESIVELRKQIAQLEGQLADLKRDRERENESWKERYDRLVESIKASIPPDNVWRCWSAGPKMYVMENLKALREAYSVGE